MFIGNRCQTKIHSCSGIICKNNGTFDTDSVKCVCSEGFTGSKCEKGISKFREEQNNVLNNPLVGIEPWTLCVSV